MSGALRLGLVALFFSAIPAWVGLLFYLSRHRPRAPDPEAGYIVPMANHGPPFYVTVGDTALFWAIFLLAFGVVFLLQHLEAKGRPKPH